MLQSFTPQTAYMTKPNIVHPQSERGAAGESVVLADEAAARVTFNSRLGITVTGGAIQRGR